MKLNVVAIPAFDDNYLWLIHDGRRAVAVDPGDATPIIRALHEHGLMLAAILLTHRHADHVGGVAGLLNIRQVPVYGPPQDNIGSITHPVGEGDCIRIESMQLEFAVLAVPGHTLGHIAYYVAEHGWLFCGDTLFAGGCGRIFEGTAAQMADSLAKLAALPDQTLVYCAHEYTLANLRFAREVEPGNVALAIRMTAEAGKRQAGQPTLPSTIGLEKTTNPFLRCTQAEIIDSLRRVGRLQQENPLAVFTALREWKNVYK